MTKTQIKQANIVAFEADAIVNAANSSLLGGGGADGAIHRAAGKELLHECRLLGGCKVGQAKLTGAHDIQSAKYIIHTVGPVYRGYSPERAAELLASCYISSLDLAEQKQLRSIAFPGISTGIYGYPLAEATRVALDAIEGWLLEHPNTSLKVVTLIAYDLAACVIMINATSDGYFAP